MLPLSKTRLFFWTWKQTLQSVRKAVTLAPFGIYAGLQILLLVGLVFYMYPPFSFIFVPLHQRLFGEAALHYPNNFIVLPSLFELLNVILGGIVGIMVMGYATLLFFNVGERRAKPGVFRSIYRRYAHLLAAWVGETGLILGVIFAVARLAARLPAWAPYLTILRVFIVICISAAFAFVTALILIENKPVWRALPQSLRMFGSYAMLLVFLVGIPTLIHLPMQFVLSNAAVVVRKLNPEVIAIVIAAGVVASIISNYLTVGAITHLYRAIGTRPDGGRLAG